MNRCNDYSLTVLSNAGEDEDIGPNCRYYDTNDADMELLIAQAPQERPEANLRRNMLAQMIKPAMKRVKDIGLAGLV